MSVEPQVKESQLACSLFATLGPGWLVGGEEVGVRGVMSCRLLGLSSELTLLSSFSCSRASQPISPLLSLSTRLSGPLSLLKNYGWWWVVKQGGLRGPEVGFHLGFQPAGLSWGCQPAAPGLQCSLFCSKAAARAHDDVLELG